MQSANTKERFFNLQKRDNRMRNGNAQARAIPLTKNRLTEADLEEFRQDIIRFNKQKQYKVLAITAVIFLIIGAAWFFLLY